MAELISPQPLLSETVAVTLTEVVVFSVRVISLPLLRVTLETVGATLLTVKD